MAQPDPRPLVKLRKLCLGLPEAHEVLSHGEPTFRVKNKMFATYANADNHHGRGRHAVWIKAAPGRQARAVKTAPDRFFVPPYVGPSGWVGVYLDPTTDWKELQDILRDAYKAVAPTKLVKQLVALAVLVLLAAACDRHAPSGPSSVGVSGRVVDFARGFGVPGAAVAFGEMTAMTDANGRYTIEHLTSGQYEPRVDGVWMGQSRVTGPAYRADLLVHPGTCVSRYGTLADARTRNPVVGATVRFVGPGLSDSAVSGSDGWYRIDLGCPANGLVGFNTTMLAASHPQYLDASQSVGRGVGGATRLDLDLEPR